MNKRALIFLSLLVLLLPLVSAQDFSDSLKEKVDSTRETLDSIPKTQEEIRDEYLVEQWSYFIKKVKFIGPVHEFLLEDNFTNDMITILFNKDYKFSPDFFLSVFLWFFVLIELTTFLVKSESMDFVKGWHAPIYGIFATMILAHIGLMNTISSSFLSFLLERDNQLIRGIVFVISIVVLVAFNKAKNLAALAIKENKEDNEKEETKSTLKKAEAFLKGIGKTKL